MAKSATSLDAYLKAGEARALALANRGPIRFTRDGGLHPDIREAYRRNGFYVFEGVIAPAELAQLKADFEDLMDHVPAARDSPMDHKGRPSLDAGRTSSVVGWSRPLGDPSGGTSRFGGRSPVKMIELAPPEGAPAEIVCGLLAPLELSDAALRAYAHPALLRVAAAINGEDFAPFQEGFLIKQPGLGFAVAWHQDGTTHWTRPDWDAEIHGFNLMLQLYPCTAANGLWYIPGSHAGGRADIAELAAQAGGNLLPGAVPLVCQAGDVAISNRQLIHGSFPNFGPDWRVTLSLGFHRRASVEGVDYLRDDGEVVTYDAERVRKRCELLGYAIDARRQWFPDETPFVYRPHADTGERYAWNDEARAAIRGYNRFDLRI